MAADPTELNRQKLKQEYTDILSSYERLAINLEQALRGFLDEESINYLAISYRIKEFDSFAEKIGRKSYSKPFNQCEDICGLRIICYYPSDIERICQIIRKEFDVEQSVDKAALLGIQEFGYRSTHFIVKVNKRWLVAPNYRGLGSLKAEIQVRTILMHAWAEIEHKLAYKKQEQVPQEFKRKLSRLSAKFEEADEQFEELRNGLHEYRNRLAEQAKEIGRFNENLDLNLDSLRAFLDFSFPKRTQSSPEEIRRLLEEIAAEELSIKDLIGAYNIASEFLPDFEDAIVGTSTPYWSQVGALRAILYLGREGYAESHMPSVLKGEKGEIIKRVRGKSKK